MSNKEVKQEIKRMNKAFKALKNKNNIVHDTIPVAETAELFRYAIRKKFEIVLNDGTSKVYTSVRVACRDLDCGHSTLRRRLNNETINGLYNFSARYIK